MHQYALFPGHHFIELSFGVFKMNSCASASYSAVVSNALTLDPCKQYIKTLFTHVDFRVRVTSNMQHTKTIGIP